MTPPGRSAECRVSCLTGMVARQPGRSGEPAAAEGRIGVTPPSYSALRSSAMATAVGRRVAARAVGRQLDYLARRGFVGHRVLVVGVQVGLGLGLGVRKW